MSVEVGGDGDDGGVGVARQVGGAEHRVLSVHPAVGPPALLWGSSQLEPHPALQSADSQGLVSTSYGLQFTADRSLTSHLISQSSYKFVSLNENSTQNKFTRRLPCLV